MTNIFKVYDIFGVYPKDINETFAYYLGKAYVTLLNCKKVVVGRDMRLSSPKLYESLVKGLIDSGCDVFNIGIASSPICNFANNHFNAGGNIMITASHHDKEYNGFKLCGKNAMPMSQISGLTKLKNIMNENEYVEAEKKGVVYDRNIDSEYYNYILSFLNIGSSKKFKVVFDYAHSMGVVESYGLKSKIEMIHLNGNIDGNFPNRSPNPSIKNNLNELGVKVRENDADFGVVFSGDGSGIRFVDENGKIIPADIITSLIAKELLILNGPNNIVHDAGSSKTVKETIEANGGFAIRSRAGSSFIRVLMRKNSAIFAGEVSGHYYFKDNSYAESSLLAITHILNILAKSNNPLSYHVHELKNYSKNDEILLEIDDYERILEKLEVFYYKGESDKLDGLTLNLGNWWFNIRSSNTEHLMKLNIEAENHDLLIEKKYELLKTIEKIAAHEI